jgi:hypothetical protein
MTLRRLHADERGIVLSFLIKVILGLVLVGLVFIEGGSIIFTKLRVQDSAESGAVRGVEYLQSSPGNCAAAGEIATITVLDRDSEAKVTEFSCLADGRFRLTVRKTASTVVVDKIGFLKNLAKAESTATASPASPGV